MAEGGAKVYKYLKGISRRRRRVWTRRVRQITVITVSLLVLLERSNKYAWTQQRKCARRFARESTPHIVDGRQKHRNTNYTGLLRCYRHSVVASLRDHTYRTDVQISPPWPPVRARYTTRLASLLSSRQNLLGLK